MWEHLLKLAAINQSVKWNSVMTALKNIAPTVIKLIYISQDFRNCSGNGVTNTFTLPVCSTRGTTKEDFWEADFC